MMVAVVAAWSVLNFWISEQISISSFESVTLVADADVTGVRIDATKRGGRDYPLVARRLGKSEELCADRGTR